MSTLHLTQSRYPSRSFAVVASCFAVMLFGVNLAGPLYAGFAERFGFSSFVLTLVFAVYALILIPSLLVFGQLSDRFGRRRMIFGGLAVATGSLVLFALSRGVGWLVAARACQGIGQGMMSGAATAALAEVYRGRDSRRPALMATLAQSGGSAAGVVVSGCVAQWLPWPSVTPFALGALACVALAGAMAVTPVDPPRSATDPRPERRWSIQRPRVPREIRADFLRVAVTAAAVWAVAGGLFLGVMPSYASAVLGTHDLALVGAVTATMLASSCLAQPVVRGGASAGGTQSMGLLLLAIGLAGLVASTPLRAPWLLVVGAAVAGVGHGVAFLAAQDELTRLAPPGQRAEISAAFYVCIYLGVAVPVIGIGVVSTLSRSLFLGVSAFAVLTGSIAIATALWHLKERNTR